MTGMDSPVGPPLEPMLARLSRALPRGGEWLYEPKWDGFRCVVFRFGSDLDMRSRNHRPLARYFPELEAAFVALSTERFVLDGEIVVLSGGSFDFTALLQRLHPAASRVHRLAEVTPASFIAFDLIAIDGDDVRNKPFVERRRLLEEVTGKINAPVLLTPSTTDADLALQWLDRVQGHGVDGVMAKGRDLPYQPGRRAMVKVKREQTADCVVGGFRWDNSAPVISSLLLGLYGRDAQLHHVGLASSFPKERRAALVRGLAPYLTTLEGHPWEHGFAVAVNPVGRLPGAASRWAYGEEITWVPLRPELVCEVSYDHIDGDRFRHPARFKRWRTDRDSASCTFDQLPTPRDGDLTELLKF